MKILVTGGTGFLGKPVVERLAQAGHKVRVLARHQPEALSQKAKSGRGSSPRRDSSAVELVRGDLETRKDVEAALRGVEVVYHLAGSVSFNPVDTRQLYRLHVDCTKQLLELARAAGISRFILASTSGTIAVSKEPRVGTEADDYPITVVGRWPYYLSKIYEEKLTLDFCRKHELPLVVLNPSLLLGPGDDRLSSTWLVTKFLNRQIPSMPNGALSFVDVRDAADVFVAALSRGEIYGRHLLGVNMSFRDFFARLERLTQVSAPKLALPSRLNVAGAIALEKWASIRGTEAPIDRHSVEIGEHFFTLDASKAERELGFHPRDPQETLLDTVRYVQAKKYPLATIPPELAPGGSKHAS
jgi:dihydroflavonol-4-reductase